MRNPRPLAPTKTYTRCGTPDYDWGIPILDLSQQEVSRCRWSFPKHCTKRHGVHPNDTERLRWFDLEALTLTLLEEV